MDKSIGQIAVVVWENNTVTLQPSWTTSPLMIPVTLDMNPRTNVPARTYGPLGRVFEVAPTWSLFAQGDRSKSRDPLLKAHRGNFIATQAFWE